MSSFASKEPIGTVRGVPSVVADVLRSAGRPLGKVAKEFAGVRPGSDFSRVRVHADESAALAAAAVHAKAFTVGHHIVFGANRFQPSSGQGRRLLAHELTHVAQQAGRPTRSDGLSLGPAGGPLEAQAARADQGTIVGDGSVAAEPGVIQRDVLPVARFSPAPGLVVDRTERSISISGAMELSGPEASAARASSVQNSINNTWTHAFPDGYSVTCNITVSYRSGGPGAGGVTQIEAAKTAGPSHVTSGLGDRSMTLNASEADAFTWTPAHEFGHIIGLRDRYSESIMSQVKGTFGGQRRSTAQPGYAGNLMADSGGTLASANVRDVAAENAPSPLWVNDDDQVRAWVGSHPVGEIAGLSVKAKLTSIRTLMGGWISDDDVDAVVRICSSVRGKPEADAIRAGVDLLQMSSLGQRTTVRVAFARMP